MLVIAQRIHGDGVGPV